LRGLAAALALALAQPPAFAQEDVGRKVFTELAQPPCGLCHALKAAGTEGTIGPSLDELRPDKARVEEAVRKGLGAMPPFAGKLTPEQIEAVSAFVARTAGKP